MARIYFQHKKHTRKAPAVIISIALLCLVAFFVFITRENAQTITGLAVYGEPETYIEETTAAVAKAYIAEEKTAEGLVLKYSEMKQGIVEIGLPVKWQQEIKIENSGNSSVNNAVISLFAPKDATNIRIMSGDKQLSQSVTAVIPDVKSKSTETITLMFETSPLWIEFVDDGTGTRVRLWHDSSMVYRNVPVEMDIKLGEKIVELVGESELDIEFDYNAGKARWILEEI